MTAAPAGIPSLTGIRGIAALWVLAYHSHTIALATNPQLFSRSLYLARDGWVGVDLFFILSGFILMHAHHGQFDIVRLREVAAFARARFYRVFPLSLVALLLVALLVAVDAGFARWYVSLNPDNLSLGAFVKTALLATRWGLPGQGDWNEPIWSLSVEVIGYALFPALAWAMVRVERFGGAVVIAVSCLAAVIGLQAALGLLGVNLINHGWGLTRMAGFFVAGMALRRAVDIAPPALARAAPVLAIASVAALPLLALSRIGPGLMPVAFATLILALYFRSGIVSAALGSRFALTLGKLSFPIYLIHLMPLMAVNYHLSRVRAGAVFYAICYLALIVALFATAWLLHRHVEQVFNRLSRRATAG